MTGVLIRDVPDEVVSAIEAKARRLGLSRTEYLRRQIVRIASIGTGVGCAIPTGALGRASTSDVARSLAGPCTAAVPVLDSAHRTMREGRPQDSRAGASSRNAITSTPPSIGTMATSR